MSFSLPSGSGSIKVAIVGYGRFGKALTELSLRAGFEVSAMDPKTEVPGPHRAKTPAALVENAALVILAVPTATVREALLELSPHLQRPQLVIDVGSVKRGPVRAMTAVLGRRIPWVATHPLFGPASIAREEQPLRVVVCPNSLHDGAATAARSYYEQLGCQVSEQDADLHDQLMATTHALAFFVAKGLLDLHGGEVPAPAPPSFVALAETIEAVTSDAGHLFQAIQMENPHAAKARERFLAALAAIHSGLSPPA